MLLTLHISLYQEEFSISPVSHWRVRHHKPSYILLLFFLTTDLWVYLLSAENIKQQPLLSKALSIIVLSENQPVIQVMKRTFPSIIMQMIQVHTVCMFCSKAQFQIRAGSQLKKKTDQDQLPNLTNFNRKNQLLLFLPHGIMHLACSKVWSHSSRMRLRNSSDCSKLWQNTSVKMRFHCILMG